MLRGFGRSSASIDDLIVKMFSKAAYKSRLNEIIESVQSYPLSRTVRIYNA